MAYLIIVLGSLIRIVEYLSNRSLWVDEAFLALNVIQKNALELTRPLIYDQHAPIGFLWLERLLYELFGQGELVLRLPPLLFGIASIYLFKKFADNYFSSIFSLLALSIFSFSDLLIRYSTELKQYSIGVAVAITLYLIAFKNNRLLLFVVGVLGLFLSHSPVFILIPIAIVYSIPLIKKHDFKNLTIWGLMVLSWVLLFYILYGYDVSSAYQNTSFLREWPYFRLSVLKPASLIYDFQGFLIIFEELLGSLSAWVEIILLFLGAHFYFKKDKKTFTLLILPLVLGLIASGFHKYPFTTRLFLYAVPALIILIVKGAELTFEFVKKASEKWLFLAVVAVLLIPSMILSGWRLFKPSQIQEIKRILSYYQMNRKPNDFTYAYYASEAPLYYYMHQYGINREDFFLGTISREDWPKYIQEIDKVIMGKRRVWFIFSHVIVSRDTVWGPMNEEEYILNHLDKKGKRIENFRTTGASIYLYEF